jgi:hypothetical protein
MFVYYKDNFKSKQSTERKEKPPNKTTLPMTTTIIIIDIRLFGGSLFEDKLLSHIVRLGTHLLYTSCFTFFFSFILRSYYFCRKQNTKKSTSIVYSLAFLCLNIKT